MEGQMLNCQKDTAVIAWTTLYFLFLLDGSMMSAKFSVEIVTLGYIYPNAGASLAYQGPALDVATEELRKTYGHVMDIKHTLLMDGKIPNCLSLADNADYMLSKWYYQSRIMANATAVISTTCGEAVNINRLASNWNILFISTAGVDNIIRVSALSPTWVTTAHNSVSSYTRLYIDLLQRYNWTTVFIVVDDSSVPVYATLAESLQHANFGIGKRLQQTVRKISSKSTVCYEGLLRDFTSASRVLLFFGNAAPLRQLMIQAAISGLIDNEFIYITVEPFVFPAIFGNLSWQYNDQFDELAKKAFRSLLILQPLNDSSLTAEAIVELAPEFILRSRQDYNFSYSVKDLNGPGMTSTFAGVALFGQILNATLATRPFFDFQNGKIMKSLFLNQTFSSVMGDLYIDQFGERAIDLSIAYSDQNHNRKIFLTLMANMSRLVQLEEMDWVGGKGPPANEPFCGYTGKSSRCAQKTTNYVIAILAVGLAAIFLVGLIATIRRFLWGNRIYCDPDFWIIPRIHLVFWNETHTDTASYWLCLV